MSIGISKSFDAGEVFEHPVGLFAVERFVDAMKMSVTVGSSACYAMKLYRFSVGV